MPAANALADEGGVSEAELADGLQCLRAVLDAGEDEAAKRISQAVPAPEQVVIDVGDNSALRDQRCLELAKRAKARKRSYARTRFRISRQLMRLGILQHLDAMLDAAEKKHTPHKRIARFRLDRARFGERRQCLDGAAHAQCAIAAARISCWVCANNSMSRDAAATSFTSKTGRRVRRFYARSGFAA